MSFLKKSLIPLLLFIFAFVLRFPTLFEPYWYGDEGIYLVLGQMMQRGAFLYRDIWDNKPPLLYLIYAINPTLLFAKISATFFVSLTVVGVYLVIKKLGVENKLALLCSLVTGVLLSLPILEGTIANAELYFTTLIVFGGYLIFNRKHKLLESVFVGLLIAFAFLIKVPALFDFVGMFFAILIIERQRFFSTFKKLYFPVGITFILVIAFTFGYFILNNAVKDFVTAAFLQNASYVEVDAGPLAKFSNPLIVRGVFLVVSSAVLGFLYWKKKISAELLFIGAWFSWSVYGSLLSNRPYLHYLLQIVPPGTILVFYLLSKIKKLFIFFLPLFLVIYYLFNLFKGGFALEPRSYYQNWLDYISEKKSFESFANYFDYRTSNSYDIGNYIKSKTNKNDPIFVWGDAAFVYVLSERPAATRYIQAHHLTTISKDNYDLIISKLKFIKPKIIVVSEPINFAFPQLEKLLKNDYQKTKEFLSLVVYERTTDLKLK